MKYIVLIICLCNLFSFTVIAKERPTVITAEIFGYQRDKVHFDFIEKEGINMEFPYKDGQLIEFMVELDDIIDAFVLRLRETSSLSCRMESNRLYVK